MAIAFGAAIGNNATFSPGTAVTSRSFTTTAAVPAGGHIVIGASWYADSNASTFSSLSGGLSWTTDHIATPLSDVNFTIALFSAPCPAGLASGSTITLTLTAFAYGLNLGGVYLTGAATSSYKDVSNATGHAVADGVWGSAITTTVADTVLIGYGYFEGETTSTPATNYTEALDWSHVGTGNAQSLVYRVVSATGSYTPGGTFAAATPTKMSVAAAYKAAGGAATIVSPRQTLGPSYAAQRAATI